MLEQTKIKLESEDYLALVSGEEVVKIDSSGNAVHIILADIGWNKMQEHIYAAAGDQLNGIKERWEKEACEP